ncbi:MAG: hypothetical protein M0R74_06615 [Dehalococcoidia bacterium]|nr:hypothetical protein [Dehalococcoidia bacterium]
MGTKFVAIIAGASAAALLAAGSVVAFGFATGSDDPAEATPPPIKTVDHGAEGTLPEVRETETPPRPEVPRAVLSSGGRSVTVEPGTRCWGNLCVDYVGPVSNLEPFVVERAQGFTVTFEAGPPTEMYVGWVDLAGVEPGITGGRAVWMGSGPVIEGAGEADVASIDLPPGRYLYTVFAPYAGRGDLSYAVYLEVR